MSYDQKDIRFGFKTVICGASSVGKTCLFNRYCFNSFNFDTSPTIGINFHSVYVSKKIKELLGISLTKAREKFKGSEFFKAKVKNKRKKDINKELLKKLILQGLTFKEIAKKFQITKPTLNSRIREFWGYQNFSEAKKHF